MRKTILSSLALIFASVSVATLQSAPAAADSTFQPSGAWNGLQVYLSAACHDQSDGIPGGACIPNSGCNGYNENTQSYNMAARAAIGTGTGMNLVERGYRARIGDGTASANLSNSNAWGANLHMPLHSNATSAGNCTGGAASSRGTQGLYNNQSDANCATQIVQKVGGLSPGTNDTPVPRDNIGELFANAPTCYFESEFHIWATGANWLTNHVNWTYKIGATADAYFGR